MKTIVTVIEKVTSEAYIEIPDGLSEPEIRQHIVDLQQWRNAVSPSQVQADFSGIILRPGNKSDRYFLGSDHQTYKVSSKTLEDSYS